jgi:hypothetical protein
MMMRLVTFLVDELLWMISWGWYQLSLGLIFSWMLLVFIGRMRTIPAIFLTVGSYAFAIVVYFIIVAGFFINFFRWEFIAGNAPNVLAPLDASLALGGIYAVLQCIFYCIINHWCRLYVVRLFVLSLMSNLAAAFFASLFIKMNF